MKILVVCQYYYPEQFRINDICETLAKDNEVTVLTGLPNYPIGKVSKEYKFWRKRKETINNVKIIRTFEIGRRKGILFRFLNYVSYAISASLKAKFLEKDFDIIYVYQLSPVTMALPAISYKKKTKKKMILYCLDLWPESITTLGIKKGNSIYKIIKKMSTKIYKKADEILITSIMFEKYFKEELGLNTDNIKYLPQYAEELFLDVQDEQKTSKENINFVFAGNIGKAQDVKTIILAANEIKTNKQIKIHIVGDGSELENCKKLGKELNTENIIFYGKRPIEEMPKHYKMADAMIVTLEKDEAISYTLPGKVQSYLAAGKPIIGAANGETFNLINNNNLGYCVNSGQYKELAEVIQKFTENIEEKEKFKENAIEYYNENFSKESFFEKLKVELEENNNRSFDFENFS